MPSFRIPSCSDMCMGLIHAWGTHDNGGNPLCMCVGMQRSISSILMNMETIVDERGSLQMLQETVLSAYTLTIGFLHLLYHGNCSTNPKPLI